MTRDKHFLWLSRDSVMPSTGGILFHSFLKIGAYTNGELFLFISVPDQDSPVQRIDIILHIRDFQRHTFSH